jgi:hypothetical protein
VPVMATVREQQDDGRLPGLAAGQKHSPQFEQERVGLGGRRLPLQEFGCQHPRRAVVADDGDLVVISDQLPQPPTVRASCRKSSSRHVYSDNSATLSEGLKAIKPGWCRSKRRASVASGARSRSTCTLTPGRCTFTATRRPSCSGARCTCDSDAAAKGSRSNSAYSAGKGAQSSASTMAAASTAAKGSAWVCRPRSAPGVFQRNAVQP